MHFKKIIPLLLAVMALPFFMMGQVTTSSMSGSVKNSKGESLDGVTVTAIHTPSGSRYATASNKSGTFVLPGIRSGGPYTVTIESVGYQKQTFENINLALGEDFATAVVLQTSDVTLATVVVTGATRNAGQVRNGVSTSVGQRQINTLPMINRSITDFTRLTPQANGNNIAGRDGRYNNVTVDGANLNNNFGLSTDPLPGGGSNPISIDAIEELSVNITPYDVRQSNFTGGNITAITKSGTNKFHGTAYTFLKTQDLIGDRIGKQKLTLADTKTNIYGGSIGGPIIKNKLFFFVNGEYEKRTLPPATNFVPRSSGTAPGSPLVSNTPVDSLQKFSDYLRSTYGYETGGYVQPAFSDENYKIVARIDWNINTVHKLTVRVNDFKATNDVALNASSVPNSATSGANTWTSTSRLGANAFSFANSNYAFENRVTTGALELNSNWNGKFSNQLITTFTKSRTTRTTNSEVFPFIDIIGDPTKTGVATTYAGGARNNYMSAGYEPYSYNNDVKNDIFNITDNFNYYLGRHALTFGASYEQQYVGNQFMAGSQSYYTYGSLAEFMDPTAHPIAFALTYSTVPGEPAPYSAELKIGQISVYAQDEYNINPRMRLTYGVRMDKPTYPTQPLENPAISALTLPNQDGDSVHYSTGRWPKASAYFSPRVNFRWDIKGDRSMIFRAGSGVYTGRIPYVYLTNMPTNSGVYQFGARATAAQLSQITFNANPTQWQSLFSTPDPSVPTGGFVLIDPDYKFPQVWRTNIGFDKRFKNNLSLSMDLIYTKDLNATVYRNANEKLPTGTVNLGGSTRPSFAANNTATRNIYSNYANALVLENRTKGGAFSWTTQVSKSFSRGFYASLAYTYSAARDLTANPGSQAASTWNANPTSGTQNTQELSYSSFATPHRIVATFSYRKEYLKNLGTTFSLFYEGSQAQGGRISYVYGAASGTAPAGFSNTADINYDGNSQDLMYVPKDPSQITFIPVSVTANGVTTTYTAQQQSDAFFSFIAQDKYLSKRMGQVAERNGGKYPFYHRVDVKLLQDVFTNIGKNRNTLQFSAECTNFLNLISKNAGIRDFFTVSNPLRATKNAATGEVRYQLATYTPNGASAPVLVDKTFIQSISTSSTWAIQLGLRYIF